MSNLQTTWKRAPCHGYPEISLSKHVPGASEITVDLRPEPGQPRYELHASLRPPNLDHKVLKFYHRAFENGNTNQRVSFNLMQCIRPGNYRAFEPLGRNSVMKLIETLSGVSNQSQRTQNSELNRFNGFQVSHLSSVTEGFPCFPKIDLACSAVRGRLETSG